MMFLAWLLFSTLLLAAPSDLQVTAPANDDGRHLQLTWKPDGTSDKQYVLSSHQGSSGPWKIVKKGLKNTANSFYDTIDPHNERYWYRIATLSTNVSLPTKLDDPAAFFQQQGSLSTVSVGEPDGDWFKNLPGIRFLLLLIVSMGSMMLLFTKQARAGKELKIRRISGIDALEEGIGRATEMGRPVLYVPGISSLEEIQTIASMLILGELSKTIAEYQTDVIVSCCVPIVREVADEVVKSGFYRAGHPTAYNPDSVQFIASDQFAFCAGTNGIMYRQKPATNIYFGQFFAESLILAETGFVNKAIQIAGTAESSQLPFFIAACDYTLIGEELFAVSAYLSKDPSLVSSLKASDWIKIIIVSLLSIGIITMSLGSKFIFNLFLIA